jgi:hypothetical protein
MKGLFYLLFLFVFPVGAIAQMDSTFGVNGRLNFDMYQCDNFPSLLFPTNDNCFIIGSSDQRNKAFLQKRKADGTVDSAFSNGLFEVRFMLGTYASFFDVVQLEDSSYLVAGNYGDAVSYCYTFMLKLNKYGVQDMQYGQAGAILIRYNSLLCAGRRLILDNAKCLITGQIYKGTSFSTNLYVTRLDLSGKIDSSFGVFGFAYNDLPDSSFYPYAFIKEDDQHYVIIGSSTDNYNPAKIAFVRINKQGTYDLSFGNKGQKVFKTNEKFGAAGVLPYKGKLFLYGGIEETPNKPYSAIVCANFDATIDKTFGVNGVDTNFNISSTVSNVITHLSIDSKGNLFYSGTSFFDTASFWVGRKNADYTVDKGFGDNGFLISRSENSNGDFGNLGALLSDGSFIVGGHCNTQNYLPLFLDIDFTFMKVKSNYLSGNNTNDCNISFFPNPCQNVLFFDNNECNGHIKLYDYLGQIVFESEPLYGISGTIYLPSLAKGVYIVEFLTAQTKRKQKLVID